MLTAMILAAALAAHPACWGKNPPRSRVEVRHFKQHNPCPAGPDKGSTKHCRGYDVDHVCPLACCGLDEERNMQWLEHRANLKKSDSCDECRPELIRKH